MKNIFRRITSMLLTLSMVISMLPAGVLTAYADSQTGYQYPEDLHQQMDVSVGYTAFLKPSLQYLAEDETMTYVNILDITSDNSDVVEAGYDSSTGEWRIHAVRAGNAVVTMVHEDAVTPDEEVTRTYIFTVTGTAPANPSEDYEMKLSIYPLRMAAGAGYHSSCCKTQNNRRTAGADS